MEVPASGKAVSWYGSLAGREEAEMRVFTMAMHAMSFSLVAEETGVGGEVGIDTGADLASVWLEVGVEVFAVKRG
jgi:hypothetical protein